MINLGIALPLALGCLIAAQAQPIASQRSYQVEVGTRVAVSNNQALWLPTGAAYAPNTIGRFEADGTKVLWTPQLSGYQIAAVYPLGGQQLWVVYTGSIRDPNYFLAVAQGNFGSSTLSDVWRSRDLQFRALVLEQGRLYGLGYSLDLFRRVRRLQAGETTIGEVLHIVDLKTGVERHLFSLTFNGKQGLSQLLSVTRNIIISVRTNGNFFITPVPLMARYYGWEIFPTQEAVEYSPSGSVVHRWNIGIEDPNTFVAAVFVDLDDSLVIDTISFRELRLLEKSPGLSGSFSRRSIMRVDRSGKVTRYNDFVPRDERVIGWIGNTRELVTRKGELKLPDATIQEAILFRKAPF